MRKVNIILLSLAIVSTLVIGLNSRAATEVNTAAVNYLKTQPDSAWKTMALVSAGETGLSGDHLKNVNSSSAIDYCAPTLAITAINKDPRTYPNQDYVAKLKSFWDGSQLGDASTLNDDVFGLLALISAGESNSDTVVAGVKNYLISKQNSDGGWGFAPSGSSDTNITSMAIMALLDTGVNPSDAIITNAINYLKASQNNDGGFPWSPTSPWGTGSDASSDSWVISTIYKLGQAPETWTKDGHNPIEHLKSLQKTEGYFEYQTGSGSDSFTPVTTSYAVIALAGKSYPVNKIFYTPTETFDLRIEGKDTTICRGKFTGPTALDIVKNASSVCGFTYEIQQTDFGPYLKKINDEAAAGLSGWLYFVNYLSPLVGAADFKLKTGDEVLWYYGDWGWSPLKLEASPTEVSSGSSITATVKFFNGSSWQPLDSAQIKTGTENFFTNASGQANLTLPDGYYKIYAEKTAYVRSGKVLVKFGEPQTQSVNLEVEVTKNTGQTGGGSGDDQDNKPNPDEISFSIDVNDVNFGTLKPGQISTKNINLANQSAKDIYLEPIVSGADVFQDNLYLDKIHWEDFGLNLAQSETHKTELKLSIPANYNKFGKQTGSVTFWAVVK